jgi:urea transporter/murein DD-endopeptidase MepM/ murein hydrolase activator NlpD
MYRSIWHKPLLRETLLPAVLNSYSVVFFLNNRILAVALLVVSFLNVQAGLCGLLSVLFTVALAVVMGLDRLQLKNGVLTFNALLTGIAMGTYYQPSVIFYFLLGLAAILSLILSASMTKWFFKNGLPFLSLPFILTFWIIVLSTASFQKIGLSHHEFIWDNASHANLFEIYLRSLSSVLFQNNPITGACIAVALLLSSRITFVLSIIALLTSWCLSNLLGAEAANFTYYNVGANYMMLAFAVGGFFNIPSKSSFLWSVLLIPVTSLVLIFLNGTLGLIHLPLFSLPFVLVVLISVHLLSLRNKPKSLLQTPIQLYSPESNFYTWQNDKGRYGRFQYVPLRLPFWGSWTVMQGYDGEHTHKGEWGQALDFMIYDHDGKTYGTHGLSCEDYHCYGKPVLAPADGTVVALIDQIDDNPIGDINTVQNWGNSIVIQHLEGVCTQLSHLKKGSFKVSKGDFVRKGDVLAACGNSGRSPEPHLHFQVQAGVYIGSKTMSYPVSYFCSPALDQQELVEFEVPKQGTVLSDLPIDRLIRKAFDFQPSAKWSFQYEDDHGQLRTEDWEAFTDAYNYKYLYCSASESVAYYYIDEGMFYFTAYYGPKTSLLYYFYLSAYKIFLGSTEADVTDEIPFNLLKNNFLVRCVNDFIAPFINRVHVRYTSKKGVASTEMKSNEVCLKSSVVLRYGKRERLICESSIILNSNGLSAFTYTSGLTKISARCVL